MAEYSKIVEKVLVIEGGYSERKKDKGNWVCSDKKWATGDYPYHCGNGGEPIFVGTMRGISAPVLAAWLNKVPTVSEMKAVTRELALEIFETNYWKKIKGDYIQSQHIADILFDGAVNHSNENAIKIMQQTLNDLGEKLIVDGVAGPRTIDAINRQNVPILHNRYRDNRKIFYDQIVKNRPSQQENYIGWMNRLKKFPYLPEESIVVENNTNTPTTETTVLVETPKTTDLSIIESADILLDEFVFILHDSLPMKGKNSYMVIKYAVILLGILGVLGIVLFIRKLFR